MAWDYSVYGVRVRGDRPISGFEPAAGDREPDVVVHTNCRPEALPPEAAWATRLERRGEVAGFRHAVAAAGGGTFVRQEYWAGDERAEMLVGPAGDRVWMNWSGTTFEEAAKLLGGPVFGCALRLGGRLCLHASTLVVDGGAFALAGPPGAGKSTTAAALVARGCALLADDVTAVAEGAGEGGFVAHPGPPRLRLWPDAAAEVAGPDDALPRIWSGSEARPDKRLLDLSRAGAARTAAPLRAVYLLAERDPAAESCRVVPLRAAERLLALTPHLYLVASLPFPVDAGEFARLGRLAAAVPVRRVLRPDGFGSLPLVCDAILDDARRLAEGRP